MVETYSLNYQYVYVAKYDFLEAHLVLSVITTTNVFFDISNVSIDLLEHSLFNSTKTFQHFQIIDGKFHEITGKNSDFEVGSFFNNKVYGLTRVSYHIDFR